MIIGLGNDLCEIERIARSVDRFGERFVSRVFTPHETAAARRNGAFNPAFLAKRFAAKEACSKALGTGFSQGVSWQDIEVRSTSAGAPFLQLAGGALQRLQALVPGGMSPYLHLSLSDERGLAQAVVIIEARANPHLA